MLQVYKYFWRISSNCIDFYTIFIKIIRNKQDETLEKNQQSLVRTHVLNNKIIHL